MLALKSACLYLPSAGIKGMYHQYPALYFFQGVIYILFKGVLSSWYRILGQHSDYQVCWYIQDLLWWWENWVLIMPTSIDFCCLWCYTCLSPSSYPLCLLVWVTLPEICLFCLCVASGLLIGLYPWLLQTTCGAFQLRPLQRGREAADLLPWLQ